MHISIEGFDGVGKTTVSRLLAERLGFELVEKPLKYLFDTDGTDKNYIRIRDYVNEVSPSNRPFSACFYALGNIYLYEKFKGKNIITDRHLLSNYAWSGSVESEPIFDAVLKTIGSPDFTFIVYGDAETICKRLKHRDEQDSDLKKIPNTEEIYKKMIAFAEIHKFSYYKIDTSNLKPEDVIGVMLTELKKRKLIND